MASLEMLFFYTGFALCVLNHTNYLVISTTERILNLPSGKYDILQDYMYGTVNFE